MGLRKPRILGGLIPWFNLYRLGKPNRRSILPVVRPIIQNRQSVRVSGLLLTILQLSRTEDYSVKPISSFRFLKMTWLDKPVADRAIYKLIKQREVSSIIERGKGALHWRRPIRCKGIVNTAEVDRDAPSAQRYRSKDAIGPGRHRFCATAYRQFSSAHRPDTNFSRIRTRTVLRGQIVPTKDATR